MGREGLSIPTTKAHGQQSVGFAGELHFRHFLRFSYSSTYFLGFSLNSSRQPEQQT